MESTITRIYIADVRILNDPRRLAVVIKAVSKQRREKAERLKTPDAKALAVGAEMLLKKAVEQVYGIYEPLEIKVGADGKPLLTDYPEIFFNLSHSGHYVVCGLGARPVGWTYKNGAPEFKTGATFFCPIRGGLALFVTGKETDTGFL